MNQVVELIGMPAAGKSTLFRAASLQSTASAVSTNSANCLNLQRAEWLRVTMRHTRTRYWRDMQRLYSITRKANRDAIALAPGFTLVDEGFGQRLVSLLVRANQSHDLGRIVNEYASCFLSGSIIAVVTTPASTAVRRLHRRNLTKHGMLVHTEIILRRLPETAARILERIGFDIIYIRGDDSAANQLSDLRRLLVSRESA